MKDVKVSHAFKANDKLCDLIGDPKDCVTVSEQGTVDLTIAKGGLPKIYFKQA
jgi:hypothetical protein